MTHEQMIGIEERHARNINNLAAENSRLKAINAELVEALKDALTWEVSLNRAEQYAMQQDHKAALKVKAKVLDGMKQARAAIERAKG